MKFSGVVPQLCNDKLCAGFDLFFQFAVLDDLLRFCCLEGRDHCTGKKIGWLVTGGAFHARIFKSFVHLRYQLQNMNRIQIKDRGGPSLIA